MMSVGISLIEANLHGLCFCGRVFSYFAYLLLCGHLQYRRYECFHDLDLKNLALLDLAIEILIFNLFSTPQ